MGFSNYQIKAYKYHIYSFITSVGSIYWIKNNRNTLLNLWAKLIFDIYDKSAIANELKILDKSLNIGNIWI